MTAKSSQPQKSKRARARTEAYSGNVKKRYLKTLRLRSKGGNNFAHAGCPGCEYCNNLKRSTLLRRALDQELADWQYEYC